jgi:hypothetical protein
VRPRTDSTHQHRKVHLDAADSLAVPEQELDTTVSADSAQWSADRLPHPLSPLDTYSGHLGSCATRLATIHEILLGGTKQAWAIAYPNDAELAEANVRVATAQAIEILLRDNVGHAEDPATQGVMRSNFRKAALAKLTFTEMRSRLQTRYQMLADKLREATGCPTCHST